MLGVGSRKRVNFCAGVLVVVGRVDDRGYAMNKESDDALTAA